MRFQQRQQHGGTFIGIILGVLVGLAAALAVAVYVTKVPMPLTRASPTRNATQDAAEAEKNKGWDPNAPLQGKPAAPATAVAPVVLPPPKPGSVTSVAGVPAVSAEDPEQKTRQERLAALKAAKAKAAAEKEAADKALADALGNNKPDDKPAAAAATTTPVAPKAPVSADPIGDIIRSKTASGGADPFVYFVQAGAFRTEDEAEAQRAKLSLMGLDAKITEREQSGRTVWRVRLGPLSKDRADQASERLSINGVESALVRVQR